MNDKRNTYGCVACQVTSVIAFIAILIFAYYTSWWMVLLILVLGCTETCGLDD